MAFRPLFLKRAALPMAAVVTAAATTVAYPRNALHAESPPSDTHNIRYRKPIYDDPRPTKQQPRSPPSSSLPSPSNRTPNTWSSSNQTPSEILISRLAPRIRRARFFVHDYTAAAEDRLNSALTSFFRLENNFTDTIASLAPAPSTGEQLLPGSLYVLVAAMAGTIITRNRNILLRGSMPVALGVGAGWIVLPYTMRNVSDLIWGWEKRVPFVAENHLRARSAVIEGGKVARQAGREIGVGVERLMGDMRKGVEGWVGQGR
ncbi:MAG: hypothetical protein LQ340_002914 [Diploschistes diacapsis]|nr:MAG: hypothetical protein LQ340_002914 [Diploschistes diacapsis]